MSTGNDRDGQPTPWQRSKGIRVFQRSNKHTPAGDTQHQLQQENLERGDVPPEKKSESTQVQRRKGIQPDGESGRKYFHPLHFFRICWSSSSHVSKWTNLLWPFTIAALVLYFGFRKEHPMWVFITAYIGMVPAANLLGFAGQELARKIPKVLGIILETTLGSLVEIVLFMVLISGGDKNVPVIQAAILGSILANMLLCLGRSSNTRYTLRMLIQIQAYASSLEGSSGRSRPSTKPSAKLVVILCLSLAWALSSLQSTSTRFTAIVTFRSRTSNTTCPLRVWYLRPDRYLMQQPWSLSWRS